ncbi:MAG: xanthine dehydrogenase family protein subunit M [Beijerinckiaceae bacterium]|nr:xanthine dehydrogenase family protein subunit M [Beijerinckiaceae bacterium]MBX9757784.1 xanthine dehydrogenase family protein subunit M [Beijerinckiaceae bacterium]MDO9439799.1 xanthine dehydrogenase family protein subunit M [Beijerinckiaceae bacterium]
MTSFDLVEPETLEDAFKWLGVDDSSVRPFGGGTALMLMMKAQLFTPVRLVSLRKLGRQFEGIERSSNDGSFRIGAMTTFSQLEHSPEIRAHLPVITQTMKTLANVRVRNVATVGGNLAHGDPHLDLPPVWMALDASATIVNSSGTRTIPVGDIFSGYYETTLEQGDLIAELRVPVRPGWRSRYIKVTTRAEHDWPALGIGLSLHAEGRVIKDLRIVLSAAIDKPTRLIGAENVLRGKEIDDALLKRAGEAAADETHIETDNRGSAPYKKHLLRVHIARAVSALVTE